ncbi:hypothetical protein [Roseivirga sp. UBA838]|uniref:hypothetical protein n=1 Tax=Roseivirga sp. UBA838 TaxID=1947393 RepID=UPI00257EA319|nr:hypothetical protein [Roseivirga sp. UBA838]|tara:strand:+ start:31562 stop:31828 length:267 start_codon:yes stop_codon:yes gene_type:complete
MKKLLLSITISFVLALFVFVNTGISKSMEFEAPLMETPIMFQTSKTPCYDFETPGNQNQVRKRRCVVCEFEHRPSSWEIGDCEFTIPE